jgi:maltose alpha-D-glucosyltransferase/alpha-amylase
LQGEARTALEQKILPAFFPAQRWFGGKARRIEAVRLVDWADFPTRHGRALPAFFSVAFADGSSDVYFVPLGVTPGPQGTRLIETMRTWVLARVTGPHGDGILHDALADDATCLALLDAIGAEREIPTQAGRIRGVATAAFAELRGDPRTPLAVKRAPATSSNSLVFYGDRLLLKLFRRLETGINPDLEIGRFLTEEHPFTRIPKVAGAVEYERPQAGPMTLAILQAAVPNQGDGWQWTLEELARYYQRLATRRDIPPALGERSLLALADTPTAPAVREAIGSYLDAAATLGWRTAEMHVALAAGTANPAFAPEPLTAADLAALRQQLVKQGRAAMEILRQNRDRLSEAVAPAAQQLLKDGPGFLDRVAQGPPLPVQACKIRIHGDYHLGQVLCVDGDFMLLDFEGEPTRTVEERRAKQSPLKDVAGMLRSFHYAAYAGLFAFTKDHPKAFDLLEPWANLWHRGVSAAFLRAYRETAGQGVFLPHEPRAFAALFDAFMLDKAFYELAYELNNRPDWVRIPLQGVRTLLARTPGDDAG